LTDTKKPHLIMAGPGAGKTRRLCEIVRERVREGVSPFTILGITFGREATQEIIDRTDESVPAKTFHGFSNWVIKLACRSRGERPPRIISEEREALLERAILESGKKYIDVKDVAGGLRDVRLMGRDMAHLHPDVQAVMRRYLQILRAENKVDFDGLSKRALQELKDPDFRAYIQTLIRRVYVDEGQDANPVTEWPLLETFLGGDELVVFASPSQQIYQFRGADWEQLLRAMPEMEVETMNRNYRSTPEIIRAFAMLAGPDADRMVAERESLGLPVQIVDTMTPEHQVDYVARTVRQWLKQDIPQKEIALLSRLRTGLYPYQQAFRAAGIPYREEDGIFARVEVQALLGYLSLALNPMDDRVLETIVNFPPCGFGTRTRTLLREEGMLTWDHLISVFTLKELFRPQVLERVKGILDLRERLIEITTAPFSLAQKVQRIVELSGIPDYLHSEGDFMGIKAVSDLIGALDEYRELGEFVEQLAEDVNTPRQASGVNMMTLHTAKGREFRAVIIPDATDEVVPLKGQPLQPEKNLAFVGMSRAKDNLHIVTSRSGSPSRFLAGMPAQMIQWP
jgi:DNA helicase-2/ATP-dependent DNA helicase PcrA